MTGIAQKILREGGNEITPPPSPKSNLSHPLYISSLT